MGASITLSLLLLALAFLAVPVGRKLTGDYYPPSVLIVATWTATMSLYFLQVIPYADLAPSTFAFIMAAIAILAVTSHAGQRLWQRARPAGRPTTFSPDAWLMGMSVAALVGVAWYVWSVSGVLGFSAFYDRPARIRIGIGDGSIPSRFLVLQYLCIATPITALAFDLSGVKIRPAVWVAVILATLGTWITTDRTQFFLVALTCYFMYVLARGRTFSYAKLALSTIALLLTLGAYFLIIGVWMSKSPANLGVEVRVPTVSAPPPRLVIQNPTGARVPASTATRAERTAVERTLLKNLQRVSTIYLYATASYAALDVLLANPQPRTYGAHSVFPVARFLDRLGLVPGGVPQAIPPFAPLGLTSGQDITFNAYTFLYYPLVDFGLLGALFYCVAIGLLSGFVYGRFAEQRSSPFWLLAMGHLSAALVLSVFVNKFNNTATWYIVLWSFAPFIVARLAPWSRVNAGPASGAAGR